MKKFLVAALLASTFLAVPFVKVSAADVESAKSMKIGFVSFRKCVETSKFGKAEQESFEKLKKQLEQSIELKEKELNDLAPKFSEESLDALTPDAERELKEKFKNLSQDLSVQQNQYFQTLNQAQAQAMQSIIEKVTTLSETMGQKMGFDIIFNDDAAFFRTDALDITKDVITELDAMFDSQKK